MNTLSDTVANLEHEVGQNLGQAVDWTVDAAKDAYHVSRDAMPVPEGYKDIALTAATVAVGLIACRPLLGRVLAGAGESTLAARAEGVTIVPLTRENLPAAVAAGKDGFRYGWPFLNPARDFKASLDPLAQAARAGSMDPTVEMNARYWLAVDKDGKVLGTTGLYETGRDKSEAAWMGWMSVRDAYRGQGIGKRLVDFSIDQAKADGKQYLRLYTSTYKGEAAAQSLYDREGIKLVGSEDHPIPRVVQRLFGQKEPMKILFREMQLKPEAAPLSISPETAALLKPTSAAS